MTKKRIVRSILSVFLSLVLIINGFLPGMPFVSTVHAESTTKTITPGTDDAKTGTGTMEISLKIKKTPSAGDFTFTPPASLIYDGQVKVATVFADAEGMGEVTVEYYNGDTKLSGAPTAEGTYTVKVNVAEGDDYKAATGITDDDWTFTILPMQKTMTITLVIKESAAVTKTPSANTLTYTGSAQQLVTQGVAEGGTMKYALSDNAVTAPVDGWNTTVPSGTNVGTYYVWYMVFGDGDHKDTTPACVTVNIDKAANPAAVTSTASVMRGGYTVDLSANVSMNGATGAVSYAISGAANGCSLDGSVLTSGTAVGSVSVNVTVAEDSNYKALAATPITVTITNKGTQTISASDVTVTYGDTGKSVSANVTTPATGGGAISYAVKDGSSDYIDVNAATGALTIKKAGTATVVVTAAETSAYEKTTKDVTVTINKAVTVLSGNQIPTAKTGLADKYGTQALVTAPKAALPVGYTMQYVLGDNAATAPVTGWSTTIPTGRASGTYYVWYKAVSSDANYADTEPVCITVTISLTVYFSVTFDMNGHGKQVPSQSVEYGTMVIKPADPVEEGWAFGGWYTDKELTKGYDFDSKVEKGFTLYAKWTAEGTEETVSLNSIAITTAPTKTEYVEGEKFDPAGMTVSANYTDGSSKAVTGYTYSPDGALTVSDNKITVSYTEGGVTCTAEQTITVTAKGEPAVVSLNSIVISTAPTKTEYTEGEKFDPAGMTVSAYYTDGSSKAVTGYTYSPDGALTVSDNKITVSYTEEGITCTANQSIKVNAKGGGEIIIDPDEVDVWNLFESDKAHEYILKGVSASEAVANSNDNSKKYYDAVLEGDTIKVSLKSEAERKKAASKANAVLSFVLEDGSRIDYTLPVAYEKTALKLSSTSATIKDGVETSVETTILVKRKGGQYEALDLSDAKVTYGSAKVDKDEGGKLIITASTGMNEKISVSKRGWESAIELKYTISAVKKDVLTVDLGGINTVILNANVADQSFDFPVYLNGEKAGEVSVDDGKKGIASYSDGTLTIAYPEGGVNAGNYTVKLTAGEAKCSVKVKVSAKDLSKAVTLKIKSKYDIVTGEPMRLEAKLKDISGVITEVSVDKEGFTAEIDENGYILVGYEGNAFDSGSTKIGNMTFSLSISDVEEPVEITLKNVKAKKAKLTVKAAAVTLAKAASEVNAVANIVCTYKDSKGVTHLIRPESTEITLKNVEAEVSAEDTGLINITGLSKKSGTIKATLTFKGGVKKTVTIKVKRAKK